MRTINFLKINLFFLWAMLATPACKEVNKKNLTTSNVKTDFIIFSKIVRDSFYISVQLPLEYQKQPKKRYPVVVVTDANFFYPMLAPVLHQYEKGGLLLPLILVGIGYKSFKLMDSLRVRDYMYPKATTSDEMKAVGGGERFYQFITTELLPKIDTTYPTFKNNRTLMGHSFGGYFSLYALLEQINLKRNDFKNFVSASPSLWYNNNYLFQLSNQLKFLPVKDSLNIFLSVGSLEEPKWSVQPVKDFSKKIIENNLHEVKITTQIYSNLDHMDVGLISFIKGLEAIYNKSNK